MAQANYRNYAINVDDCVVIRLDSNFATNIKPTNSMREDEYANYVVNEILDKVPKRDIEISEDNFITIRIGLHFRKLALSIRFYDLTDYNNPNPNFAKNIPDGLLNKIEKTVQQYIDSINEAKIEFISFDNDEFIQIFDNKIYGYFFDLNTNTYVQPPKVIKNILYIDGPKVDIRERIESFIKK